MVMVDNVEAEVRRLWDLGRSRNQISKVLHIGHNRVQRIVEKLPREVHEIYKRKNMFRFREKAKEIYRDKGLTYGQTLKKVRERSELGLRLKYDESVKEEFIEGDRDFSPAPLEDEE